MSGFLRTVGVGVAATVADLLILALLIEGLGASPSVANGPALLSGAIVQFLGCRHLVFGAGRAALWPQVRDFALTEAGALVLNGALFHLWIGWMPAQYTLARLGSTSLVFAGFSYPMWRKVFGAAGAYRCPIS